MNIELKPIAESKVRQLGGDVCGVLVRKGEKLAAVDEHGRCTRLDGGVMGPVEPAESSERELFEQKFPVPEGIEWSDSSQMYSAIGGVAYNVANHWNIRLEAWQAARAQGDAEPIGFIPYSGLSNLAAGHPAKIYPVDATPSPFESHKMLYTQPQPAVPEGEERLTDIYRRRLFECQDALNNLRSEYHNRTAELETEIEDLQEELQRIRRQPAVPDTEAVRLARKWLSMTETEGGHLHYDDVTKMAEALLSTPTTPQADGWIPDWLYDGYAVYQNLTDEQKTQTSAKNVSDTLDAIVAMLKRPEAPAGREGAQ